MFVKSKDITKLLVSVGAKPKSNVNVELNVTVKMEYVPLHVAFPPPNICHHTDSGASSQDVSMIAEPISLQAMCINIICFTHKKMKGYELNLGNFRLPVSLSADLLFVMVKYRLLSDESIRMFNSKHTNLTSVALHDVMLSIEGLEVLRQHRLTELTLNNVGIYLEDAISNRVINSSTSKSLRSLSLYNFRMEEDYMQRTVMTDLARRFTNLVHLSLVSVRLENDGLSSLCSVLTPTVTHLDISRNFVTDISPLTKFSASLKFLNMYNLYSVKESNAKILMFELKELLHLNISCESGHQLEAFLNEGVTPLSIEKMLLTPGGLAKLQSIDLSGREHITEDVVKEFLNLHPKISFVGLLLTPAANIQDADSLGMEILLR
ncbi:hypothetical protein EB796_022122 [Bugula neritina]|uniref:Uncharacterized protein n=1 Tax=Bugula neritina TaxID=10212 RepID=A0A7J7J045_BUGNE|nr:hypothetical protein EB796_022122 [Bugula neritina]